MSALLKRAHRVLLIVVAAVFGLTLLSPMATLANTDIQVGQQAIIANPNGTGANLRSEPVLDETALITEIPQGTAVNVTDGPLVTDTGTWFWVSSDVGAGWVSADMLGAAEAAPAEEPVTEETTTEPVVEEEPTSPDLLWQEPVDAGFVVDNNNEIPAEGLACRATATVDGEVITRVPVNATLQVAGPRIWQGEQSFVHINCGDGAGYVNGTYVVLQSEQAAEPVVTEAPVVEEPTVAPEVPVEPEVTEAPVEEAPVVTEAPVVEEPVTEATGETGPRFATDNVNLRAGASDDSEVLTVLATGEQVELTGVVGNGYVEVNANAGNGFVAQEFLGTEAPVTTEPVEEVVETPVETELPTETTPEEPVAPAEPTEEVVEAPVETEAPATEDTTEAPVEEEVPTEPVVEETVEAETPAETDVAAEEPVQEDVPAEVEAPAAEDVTEAPADDAAAEDAAVSAEDTTVSDPAEVDAPAADEAVENADENAAPVVEDTEATEESADVVAPAADEAVENADENAAPVAEPTEEATEAPADAATTSEGPAETPVPTEQPKEEKPAVPAVTAPAFDASTMIGSATVTGTNGDGLICRVSPEAGAATLMVLSEGTKVLVAAEPVNGYLGIDCGGLQGFADVNFLWSGGAGDEEIQKASMSLVVSGTGNGLNCRTGASTSHPVITVLRDGTTLKTRAAASNGWVAVVCGGQNGFVSTPYVEVSGGSGSASASTGTASGTATVSNTNGDGLYCRSGAGTSYSAITVLSPGQKVTVRGGDQGSWTPIICGGTNGFAHSSFLSASSGSGSTSTSGTSTGKLTVANTGGQGLNCRSGAGTSHGVITVLRPGQTIDSRSGSTSGWQAVICGSQNGFVSSEFVTGGGSSSTAPEAPSTGSGGTATVSNTNGDGLYCRSGAGTGNSVITVLSPGQKVSVRGGASNGWLPITCGGKAGWASSQFLTVGGGSSSPAPSEPSAPAPAPSGLASGDHAKTTDTLNLRYSPSLGAGIAAAAPAGTVVKITGGASGDYYPVNWDGLQGYMSGDYLTETSEALSQRGGSGSPGTTTPPTSGGGGTATGNAIVDYAMRYLGYPYVWATHGPASFDCSGFTYWVIQNVVGKNIGYGTWTQVSAGQAVSKSNLQPGDLVFFQNTYTAGLSHVGIYIGNNKFIHAQNESTGVVISDLDSSYYGPRWYGAVRI